MASTTEHDHDRFDDEGLNGKFDHFATHVATLTGHSVVFIAAFVVVVVWAISGPIFHFSDTWQLIINTGTTVLTFLMVFIIQNTMNRENAAMNLKLDELIKVTKEARNALMGSEKLTEEQIEELAQGSGRPTG